MTKVFVFVYYIPDTFRKIVRYVIMLAKESLQESSYGSHCLLFIGIEAAIYICILEHDNQHDDQHKNIIAIENYTVCARRFDPLYIVSYYIY